jgi:MYXO-CTERM domain-containing protein
MPSDVLDKQNPAADTSKHPVLTRSSAHYVDPERREGWQGCMRLLACRAGTGSDASGGLVVLAVLVATRRRNRS